MRPDHASILPPRSGLMASRITLEYGGYDEFIEGLELALARSDLRGATVVAYLDRGDIATHLPGQDAPCWNAVPLVHLRPGETATTDEWGTANAILEKLERYR